MNDTSPEIAAMVHERMMALSGQERLLMGSRMNNAARRMVLASFPKDITPETRKRMLFDRLYGNELEWPWGEPNEGVQT